MANNIVLFMEVLKTFTLGPVSTDDVNAPVMVQFGDGIDPQTTINLLDDACNDHGGKATHKMVVMDLYRNDKHWTVALSFDQMANYLSLTAPTHQILLPVRNSEHNKMYNDLIKEGVCVYNLFDIRCETEEECEKYTESSLAWFDDAISNIHKANVISDLTSMPTGFSGVFLTTNHKGKQVVLWSTCSKFVSDDNCEETGDAKEWYELDFIMSHTAYVGCSENKLEDLQEVLENTYNGTQVWRLSHLEDIVNASGFTSADNFINELVAEHNKRLKDNPSPYDGIYRILCRDTKLDNVVAQ